MNNLNFSGATKITNEGIKKHFKNFEPIKAILELVWNGFDANAKNIRIDLSFNELNGVDTITILDDGEGIDVKNIHDNFERFNDSSKKNDDDKHGSHGRGRLSFHKLSNKATWYTKRENYNASIIIESGTIKNFDVKNLSSNEQHHSLTSFKSGTCVELVGVNDSGLPENKNFHARLEQEFGWFLALNSDCTILLNDEPVAIPSHDIHKTKFSIDHHNFIVKIIRWDSKPTSEKSYNYLVNSKNKTVQKELSRFNNKVTFHSSAFVFSKWIDNYDPDIMGLDPNYHETKRILKLIMDNLLSLQTEIYNDFLRKYVDEEIEKYDSEGYFITYQNADKNYAEWRKNNTKSVVKEIYIADPTIFNRLKPKQAKILIRLLDRVLVSNNNSLFDVLDGILDLADDSLNQLAKQLQKTTIENIVYTIDILQKRQEAVGKLREIMDNRFSEILETPDLQKIIENNTWLFGPQYTTLGAEEDSFTSIAKKLRNSIKEIDYVTEEDIAQGTTISGVNRQVDLFLARKVPSYDSDGKTFFKCVIIEIKRPGISLNKKHLQQLDDYAEIISKHPAFTSEKMLFELILVGRKISRDDYFITKRIEDLKDQGEKGLVSKGKIKCFVKNWFTIFDEFDLSNDYLLNTLNSKLIELSQEKTDDIVKELQTECA